MTSSSIQKPYLKSQRKNLNEKLETTFSDDDFFEFSTPKLENEEAAKGINFIFDNFDYELHTFQFKGVTKDGKNHSPVKVYKRDNRKAALEDAIRFNQGGYDVYFMVNEGDGVVHEGKKIPRSQASVLNLSKCFIDTDDCPIEKVEAYLEEVSLPPHAVVESSPGKFHLYFFLNQVPKEPKHIIQWKAVQQMIHRLGDPTIKNPSKELGMDSTMSDFSKLLRVPGFLHINKKTIVKVKEVHDILTYDLNELFVLTRAQEYIDYNVNTYGAFEPSHVPDLESKEILKAGERFHALQSLSLHLANQLDKSTLEEKKKVYATFVRNRLDNSDGVYVESGSNKLTEKAVSLFTSAMDKVQTEEKVKIETIHRTLETKDNEPSPWALPDEFYLNAPNGFGDIVKQVMHFSLYPCAALAFGTFITGLSIIKSKTHLTPTGSSPALYTLNVAPSGYGKNAPMSLLQNTFVANNLRGLIGNEVRSDRGLYNHLASNDGYGILILDEVAPLLKSIQDKDANTHLANVAKAFLQLYSAGAMKGISFGKLAASAKKNAEPEIILNNPMLAICGFTVPTQFSSMFNSESVTTGLFQRFIPIVAEITYVKPNPNADSHAVIKSELFQIGLEPQELDDKTGDPVHPLQATKRIKMQYTDAAQKLFNDLQEEYRQKLIQTAQDPDLEHTSGLYSRLAEQIERVATVLSPEEINVPTLEYAVKFIESRHKAVLKTADITVLRSKGSQSIQNEKILLDAVARLGRETESSIIPKRDAYQRCRRHFATVKDFDQAIMEAELTGSLEVIKGYRKDAKASKPMTVLKLADVLS